MDDNVTDLTANTVPSGMTWLPPMLPICGGIQAPPMSGRRRTTQCGMSSRAPARSGPRHRQPATRHRPPATARPAAGWPAPLVARGSGDETDGGTWFLLLAMPGRPRGQPMALNRRARTGLGAAALCSPKVVHRLIIQRQPALIARRGQRPTKDADDRGGTVSPARPSPGCRALSASGT